MHTYDAFADLVSPRVLRAGPLACAALALAAVPADAGPQPALRRAARPRAHAARTISLQESGRLHLVSKHNFTLEEQGVASGTAAGAIAVRLTAVSSTRMTVEVSIHPKGGSLSGSGSGSYRRNGAKATFSGSMTIDGGSGEYTHVHGSGLDFSGTIEESDRDAITVRVSGRVSD